MVATTSLASMIFSRYLTLIAQLPTLRKVEAKDAEVMGFLGTLRAYLSTDQRGPNFSTAARNIFAFACDIPVASRASKNIL